MEPKIEEHDIVIVGAGIAGLTTALGLHRLGIRSLVLESSDGLRITGFAFTMWTNAWRALDALGVGDFLRDKSFLLQGLELGNQNPGPGQAPQRGLKFGKAEIRCVRRKELLETLEREVPQGTIRYSSKIVSIEEFGNFKLLHLADGSIFRTKMLIGCDGVNSMVAKWLGLQNPVSAGRSAIRGYVAYRDGHGFEPKFHTYFGGGLRYGIAPCDDKSLYWFCTFTPSHFKYDEDDDYPLKMKQFVISRLSNAPKRISDVVERTELDCISRAPLKFRLPWNILLGSIVRNNVCVAGDALHPMTPDLGQGGCSAMEDGIVLARCLGEALITKETCNEEEEDYVKMAKGLEKYARERRWRSFRLVSIAYVVGWLQESNNRVVSIFREKIFSRFTARILTGMADFECGKLSRD